MAFRKPNRWKKKYGRNLHHLTPKSRQGSSRADNLLLIKVERHVEWHKVFGNRTLEEVIALLTRLARMKGRTHVKKYRQAA